MPSTPHCNNIALWHRAPGRGSAQQLSARTRHELWLLSRRGRCYCVLHRRAIHSSIPRRCSTCSSAVLLLAAKAHAQALLHAFQKAGRGGVLCAARGDGVNGFALASLWLCYSKLAMLHLDCSDNACSTLYVRSRRSTVVAHHSLHSGHRLRLARPRPASSPTMLVAVT